MSTEQPDWEATSGLWQMRAVAAEEELVELRAENAKLVADYVPMVSSDFLRVQGGVATLTMTGAREVVARMAEGMAMMLDDAKAENYIEMDAVPAEGKRLTLRVQRGGKPTPHDLRVRADERAAAAEAELAELRAKVETLCDETELEVYLPHLLDDNDEPIPGSGTHHDCVLAADLRDILTSEVPHE